jgi:hypothetical protein
MLHEDVYRNLVKKRKSDLQENFLPLKATLPVAREWQFDSSGSCRRMFSFNSKQRMFLFLQELMADFNESYSIPMKFEIDENHVLIQLGNPDVHGGYGLESHIAQSITSTFNNIQFYSLEKDYE